MDLPLPRFVTRRLVLRPPGEEDIPALLDFLGEERTEMRRTAPRRPAPYFTEGFWWTNVAVVQDSCRNGSGLMLLLFEKKGTGAVVGRVTLSRSERGPFQSANLGYSLRATHRGRGLMHEALKRTLSYAFGPMRLHRVAANYMPSNRASGRVLRRLGFRRDGLAKDYLLIDGEWEDHVLTCLVNPRWRPDPMDPSALAAAGRPPITAFRAGARGGSRRSRRKGP